MLDLMRRKKRLKIVLWLVIIGLALGMLLFFVPGQNVPVVGFDSSVANVAGEPISVKEFSTLYRRILDDYRADGKNRLDPETLKRFGFERQALDSLVTTRVTEYAAKRLGLDVSREEVRRTIMTNPSFQDRGAFVGPEVYKAILASNRMDVTEFEENLRLALLSRKLRHVIADSMDATESELRDEFARANVEAQVSFAILKLDDFKKRVTTSESDLRAYFDANKEKYRIGEQRRTQYLLLSLSSIATTIKIPEKEIQDKWDAESKEESMEASHILFEAKDPAKDAAVKAKAEAVLNRVKAGADFAGLAKKYSEDKGSAATGGSLGTFTRGRMVKEFEDVAFSLKPGEVSDLVRTQYGYHIIKVLRHIMPNLETRRPSIERSLQLDKASDLIKQKAAEAQRLGETQKDLDAIGKALNVPYEIRETGFLSKNSDPIASGVTPSFLDETFRIKDINTVGKAADHPTGYALPKLLEVRLPKPPDFTESHDQVKKDYIEAKAQEQLDAEAKRLSEEAGKAGDLEKAAKKDGFAVKTTQPFKRDGTPDPELSSVPAFNDAAFATQVGAVSPPIRLDAGRRAVLQVKSRTPFDENAYNKQKEQLRTSLIETWRDAYFQEYLRRVLEDLEKSGKVRINSQALEEATKLRYY